MAWANKNGVHHEPGNLFKKLQIFPWPRQVSSQASRLACDFKPKTKAARRWLLFRQLLQAPAPCHIQRIFKNVGTHRNYFMHKLTANHIQRWEAATTSLNM